MALSLRRIVESQGLGEGPATVDKSIRPRATCRIWIWWATLSSMSINKKQGPSLGKLPKESHYLPELDGVRGLAILGVLLAHGVLFLGVVPNTAMGHVLATIFVPGWGGVDLFFTLSGFLITGILLRARKRQRYFASFYMRRVLRIFPIYYLFLAGTLLAAQVSQIMALQIPSGFEGRVPYFFYLQNWPVFWRNWTGIGTLWGAYWSLAVEEQFYLVWPAVVRFVSLRAVSALCISGFLCSWGGALTCLIGLAWCSESCNGSGHSSPSIAK
jgi:peptidoglycan/LPS O-acetylase OafA/YrhL